MEKQLMKNVAKLDWSGKIWDLKRRYKIETYNIRHCIQPPSATADCLLQCRTAECRLPSTAADLRLRHSTVETEFSLLILSFSSLCLLQNGGESLLFMSKTIRRE